MKIIHLLLFSGMLFLYCSCASIYPGNSVDIEEIVLEESYNDASNTLIELTKEEDASVKDRDDFSNSE